MEFLRKYLLLLFLIANVTAEYIMFMSVSKYLFYAALVLSVFFLPSKKVVSMDAANTCPHIYALAGILIIYQLLFGMDPFSYDSATYFVGKIATFAIMMLCISHNFEFYLKKSILPFSYIILALIVLGWFFHRTSSASASYLVFGFSNRNAACAVAAIGFAGFLFAKETHCKSDYLCMAILFFTILIGGSRNSLAMCILFVIIRYGLSMRMLAVMALSAIIIIFVLPEMGIEINAFDRLVDTVTGNLATDREAQRQGALMMIQDKPITGWGLASQIQGAALRISHYGAHNGYLTLIMYMGLPLGIAFIGTIAWGVLKRFKLYRLHDNILNYHLAVMASILFAANQEDYLVGVNQIITNMFFVSFVVTGLYAYYYKHGYIES